MIDLETLQLHDIVQTPSGSGVYQGSISENGVVTKLIVTHPVWRKRIISTEDVYTETLTHKSHGIWWTAMYPIEQVTPYQYVGDRKERKTKKWTAILESKPPTE